MDTAKGNAKSLLDRLMHWLTPSGLADLPEDDVARMAHDLGVSESGLRQLAASGPASAALLYQRMKALGITDADIERLSHGLLRTLEIDCSCCASKDRCAQDLAHQPIAPGWMSYCSNAATLNVAASVRGRALI